MEYWHTGALMSEGNWFKLLLKRKDPEILDSMETSVRTSSVSNDDDDSRLISHQGPDIKSSEDLRSTQPDNFLCDNLEYFQGSVWSSHHPRIKECLKGQVRVCFHFLFSILLTSP